jgi:N-ethylmaleimide reductase
MDPTHRKLFSPAQVGPMMLAHRVVMAPLTRSRSTQPGDVPNDLMAEYYAQRASEGGFIVSEAAAISVAGRGWFGAPGLYSDEQVAGWEKITAAVHARGARMFAQLWHVGRSSNVAMTGGATPVSASVNPSYWLDSTASISAPGGWVKPSPHRALALAEIPGIVEDYRRAARRAKAAGFDGVELHAANGYLPDQFLQDGSNQRTDAYGGPVENRGRFLLEVVEGLASVWGGERVAVRIGPAGTWNAMSDSNPAALFGYVAGQLNRFGLAYLHVIEPRVKGNVVVAAGQGPVAAGQMRKVFQGKIIAAGGFEPDSAEAVVEKGDADLVAFGRHFIANPDLPRRIRLGLPLNAYDRSTFYTFDSRGYTDYPAYDSPAAAHAISTTVLRGDVR